MSELDFDRSPAPTMPEREARFAAENELTVWNSNRVKIGAMCKTDSPEELSAVIDRLTSVEEQGPLGLMREILATRLRWERVAAVLDNMTLPQIEEHLGISMQEGVNG